MAIVRVVRYDEKTECHQRAVGGDRELGHTLTKRGTKTMKNEDNLKVQFLIGLSKLTRKTGIGIGGCGCCGSPYIEALGAEELADERAGYGYGHAGEVSWISPSDPFLWENFVGSVARTPKRTK